MSESSDQQARADEPVGEASHDARDAERARVGADDPAAGELVRALPGVASVVAQGVWRTNLWALGTSLRMGHAAVQGALAGDTANEVLSDVGEEARESVRRALGVPELPNSPSAAVREGNGPAPRPTRQTVAERFSALLDASARLDQDDTEHPAYTRLVGELAPDEARILRLLAIDGPQPAVDVRTRRPLGAGSTLVASGVTMIGRHAGCRYSHQVAAYLDNLFRLGLVRYSREPLADQARYDVLEAQPEVTDALERAGRGTTSRRSIELTAFGQNLCTVGGLVAGAGERGG